MTAGAIALGIVIGIVLTIAAAFAYLRVLGTVRAEDEEV